MSGGLEVASDRLLELMKKGVTVEQVARVTRAFTDAGIMVHAYLMYGFPTETEQDTVDALERVRQLFAAGLHPVGVLASLRGDGALADRAEPRAATASRCGRRRTSRSRTTTSSSTIPPARTTTSSARGCARRSTTTCTASDSTPTCASGSSRPRAASARRAGDAPQRAVPRTTVPPDLIERFLG